MCVVAAALRRGDGRWLLHRRPIHKHHGGLWEFPGGKVEDGETPLSALLRELGEELGIGLDAGGIRPLAFAEDCPREGDGGIVILLYTAEAWEGEPRPLEEGSTLGWFTPGEIGALDRPPLDVALGERIFGAPGEAG